MKKEKKKNKSGKQEKWEELKDLSNILKQNILDLKQKYPLLEKYS